MIQVTVIIIHDSNSNAATFRILVFDLKLETKYDRGR